MKTKISFIILSVIMMLGIISCKKDEYGNKQVTFSGSLSTNGRVSINGVTKSLLVAYDVKKGDVLRFDDYGNDFDEPPFFGFDGTIYPGNHIEGYTSGYIIMNYGVDGVEIVAQHEGYSDCHLYYVVK